MKKPKLKFKEESLFVGSPEISVNDFNKGKKKKYTLYGTKKTGKKTKKREERVQIAVAAYVKAQYPDVIMRSDLAGMRLPIHLGSYSKKVQSSRAFPDLSILEPKGAYAGLFLELKNAEVTVFKKGGELRKDDHLHEQHAILEKLKKKGYYASFAVGFDQAKGIIDWYMGIRDGKE